MRRMALLLIVASQLAVGAAGTRAAEDEAAPQTPQLTVEAQAPPPEAAAEMVIGYRRALGDVRNLAPRILALSPDQQEQIERLALRQAEDRARATRQVDEDYARQVRALLTPEQQALYDAVRTVLTDLEAEEAAARAELMAAAEGAPAEALRRPADTIDGVDLLGLDPPRRARLAELREAYRSTVHAAVQARPDPEDALDPEVRAAYRQGVRAAMAEADAAMEAGVDKLLTEEERARLKVLDAALAAHTERVRRARHAALDRLHDCLSAGAGADAPAGQ